LGLQAAAARLSAAAIFAAAKRRYWLARASFAMRSNSCNTWSESSSLGPVDGGIG
jgi:hypothetical protein